jgi:hypothetical protein
MCFQNSVRQAFSSSAAHLEDCQLRRPAGAGQQHEAHGTPFEAEAPFDVLEGHDAGAENDDAHGQQLVTTG